MIITVEVDVATARPPRVHRQMYVQVEAPGPIAAILLALQMAATHPNVVMPVGARVVREEESDVLDPPNTTLQD